MVEQSRVMDDPPPSPVETTTLSLSRAEQWTLHHVLLDRLDRLDPVEIADDAASAELREAFETLDSGGDTFTRGELERMQSVLARYHHRTTWWMVERPRLEGLLHSVSTALERGGERDS